MCSYASRAFPSDHYCEPTHRNPSCHFHTIHLLGRLGHRSPMRHTVHRSTSSFSVSFVAIRFCPEVAYPATIFVIVEFSRSPYMLRALSGLVAPQGPLAPQIALDQERAYSWWAEAWYRYRRPTIVTPISFAHPAEVTSNLQAFGSNGPLTDEDFTAVDRLAAVAVWDTVGAMGSSRLVREVYLRGWNKTFPS